MASNSGSHGGDPAAKLTDRQRRFVAEYLIDLNATAAYKRAGYTGKGKSAENAASRLLGNVGVAAVLKTAMEKRSSDLGIDANYVLSTIKETVDRCRQVYPVLNRKGEQVYVKASGDDDAELVPAFTFDAQAVLKGAELLGKHLRMFTDRTEVSGPNGAPLTIQHNLHELSDAELMAIVMQEGG
jgi:phage terminase small subunit